MSIGVPIKVLHEAEGHIVTCETITGEVYRGKLIEAEDNMNCQMTQITVTYRDGRVAQLENVYIRGSKIRFLILPDMLKNAPMFKRQTKAGTAGRGKSAILRAQGEFNKIITYIRDVLPLTEKIWLRSKLKKVLLIIGLIFLFINLLDWWIIIQNHNTTKILIKFVY